MIVGNYELRNDERSHVADQARNDEHECTWIKISEIRGIRGKKMKVHVCRRGKFLGSFFMGLCIIQEFNVLLPL